MKRERLIQYFIALVCGLHGWQDNKVQRIIRYEPHHSGTEAFPYYTLDAISANGFGTGLFGDRHAKPVMLLSIGPGQNSEAVVT